MLKKFAWLAPMLLFGASLAFAENPAAKEPPSGAVAAKSSSLSGPNWLASDLYKANVYDNSEQKIGDIKDLVIDKKLGSVSTSVIGIGGFLGIGEKDAGVPFKDLKAETSNGKDWLVVNETKDQLSAAPAFEPKQVITGRSAAEPSQSQSSLATDNWLLSEVYKADVYDNSEQKIGNITDLMMDRSGKITDVGIKTVSSLGANQKVMAVPLEDLKVASREGKTWLVLNQSKDELMNAPAFQNPENKKM